MSTEPIKSAQITYVDSNNDGLFSEGDKIVEKFPDGSVKELTVGKDDDSIRNTLRLSNFTYSTSENKKYVHKVFVQNYIHALNETVSSAQRGDINGYKQKILNLQAHAGFIGNFSVDVNSVYSLLREPPLATIADSLVSSAWAATDKGEDYGVDTAIREAKEYNAMPPELAAAIRSTRQLAKLNQFEKECALFEADIEDKTFKRVSPEYLVSLAASLNNPEFTKMAKDLKTRWNLYGVSS